MLTEIFIDIKEKRYQYEQDFSLYGPNYCATRLVVPLVVVYPYIYERTSPRCVLILSLRALIQANLELFVPNLTQDTDGYSYPLHTCIMDQLTVIPVLNVVYTLAPWPNLNSMK